MMRTVIEGAKLLNAPPPIHLSGRGPTVRLGDSLRIDDDVLQKPTLILGQVSSGKSTKLREITEQIFQQMEPGDNAIIFAAKREMIAPFYRPGRGDRLLSIDAVRAEDIWNIFLELDRSEMTEQTANELARLLFADHRNGMQPFFSNAAEDIFRTMLLYLHSHYWERTGKVPDNETLVTMLLTTRLNDRVVDGKVVEKGLVTIIRENPRELGHLEKYIGDGKSALPQSLGCLGELTAVIRSTFLGGAFCRRGTFSTADALNGQRTFLLYDYARSSVGGTKLLQMILDQMLKSCIDDRMAGQRKTWFILDEYSLLPHLQYIRNALSFGRAAGFRIIACAQSVTLLQTDRDEQEAKSLLSLFPNVITFFTTDSETRSYLASRYGKNLSVLTYMAGGISRHELRECNVINDWDFLKIHRPGNSIVSLAGYEPFYLMNNKE
ncbi:MAG: type IV secretion system DNA-binding domain-containing protein [Oscillospiraceae bacterium]|nr:type IV secretion system DNA-binding domain-containing protein [Oscillospiraceae bacterium]